MSLFKDIENSSQKQKFIFMICPLILIFLFIKLDIKLNIIFWLVISVFFIIYYNYHNQKDITDQQELYDIKHNAIRPKSEIIKKYDILVDFLFYIQDFYASNPPAYEEMITNIEIFIQLYEEAKELPELSGNYYKLAMDRKKLAVNNLHSIIYLLPTNKILTKKLNESVENLNNILSLMLEELYVQNLEFVAKHGYNNRTVIINKGPKESNHFDKELKEFDLY